MSADRVISLRVESDTLDYWRGRAEVEGVSVSELLRRAATQTLSRPYVSVPTSIQCSGGGGASGRAYVEYPGTFSWDLNVTPDRPRRRWWQRKGRITTTPPA